MISPEATSVSYPTLLDLTAPNLLAYPPESVVAEKFQALVTLGLANTRMKDFYDIWILADRRHFDGPTLSQAIQATFRRRRTPVPSNPPVALTAEFHDDHPKQQQWKAFLTRTGLAAPPLSSVTECLGDSKVSSTITVVTPLSRRATRLQWAPYKNPVIDVPWVTCSNLDDSSHVNVCTAPPETGNAFHPFS